MKNSHTRQQLSNLIDQAFSHLGLSVASAKVESLSSTIYQAMSGEGRYYHTPSHALRLSDPNNSIHTLAAVFHDIVYEQIDHGFPPGVWSVLEPYLRRDSQGGEHWYLVDAPLKDDFSFHLAKDIFGLPDHFELYSTAGSNEFLSSLVMAKKLEHIVTNKTLLQVIACIEATIPFRVRDENGLGPFEHLARRLEYVSRNETVLLAPSEIVTVVQEAVRFANKDVENFTLSDTASFLESSWLLLPESNPAVRHGVDYTLHDYRLALQSMGQFLCSIDPKSVLHDFQGVPSEAELQENLLRVQNNLTLGCAYLEIKLLAVAILEALAETGGSDRPVSLFLGDVSRNGDTTDDLCNFFPPVQSITPSANQKDVLFQLLQAGLHGPVDFADVKTSCLALFIYISAGSQNISRYLQAVQEMFAGKINPREFLQGLDASMVAAIAGAVAKLAEMRTEKQAGE